MKQKEKLFHVQMVRDNYDIIHNPKVKEKYPELYKEVCEHDKLSGSSWYDLSEAAHDEYEKYIRDIDIGYVG